MNKEIKVDQKDNVLILYHGSDFDGRCSAAITYKFFSQYTKNIELIPLEHDTKHKLDIKSTRNKIVVMVDFSLEQEKMFIINRISQKFYWIDHHNSAMKEYTEYHQEHPDEQGISGLREDQHRAACELTYLYFFDDKVPYPVKLLSIYDVGVNEQDKEYDINQTPFQYGLKAYDTKNIKSEVWNKVTMDRTPSDFITEVLLKGKPIIEYETILSEEYIDTFIQTGSLSAGEESYENIGILNRGMTTPILNTMLKDKFEIAAVYVYRIDIGYVVSLYSKTIDCSKIAQHFGGGGHPGAAGFRCKELPFEIN